MSHCIEKLSHSCGSSDGLQVFEQDGEYSGYCFSCSTYVASPYSDKEEGYKPSVVIKTPEQIQEEIDDINTSLKPRNLVDRKLMASSLAHFGIRVGVSETDGTTVATHFYPYRSGAKLTGFKCRVVENKKMFAIGTTKGADLFNWANAIKTGSPRLYITEGELDAATVYQVIKKKQAGTQWADREPAVVSLKDGSSSARRALSENADKLNRHFREVVLVFDMDEQGRKAVREAMLAYPSCISVDLPDSDANDCLVNGKELALANALLFQAAKPKSTNIVTMTDLVEKALDFNAGMCVCVWCVGVYIGVSSCVCVCMHSVCLLSRSL